MDVCVLLYTGFTYTFYLPVMYECFVCCIPVLLICNVILYAGITYM